MDYRRYEFTWKERMVLFLEYLLLDGAVSFLFYRSWIPFVLFLPGFLLFLKLKREEQRKKRIRRLGSQFLTGMQAVSNALAAGYSVENAFGEALKDLQKAYGNNLIVTEFSVIVTQLSLGRTLESLLEELAARSGEEDIKSFAEVFAAAKRSGGDLISIIRNTVSSISQKEETRQEIQVCIAAKKLEQNVMSVVPLFILAYVGAASPGFLDVMYHNVTGIAIMSICLVIYFLAWMLGRRIVEIEV
ncbi:MAG: type II secretion system F family protein [Blautia sp.]|nr:type II secretion system F family protein [Blautia sp.]MDY4516746.1 type II secretion system F family protein [Lachnospiraceae bacterium]